MAVMIILISLCVNLLLYLDLLLGISGVRILVDARTLFHLQNFKSGLGILEATQPPTEWVPGLFSKGHAAGL